MKVTITNTLSAALLFAALLFTFQAAAADRETDFNTHSGSSGPDTPEDNDQPKPKCGITGSPVYLKDLQFFWRDVDVAFSGRPNLQLSRTYNSFDSRDGIFGKGWTERCERSLIRAYQTSSDESAEEPTRVESYPYIYRAENGRRYDFIVEGDDYLSPEGMTHLTLVERDDGNVELVQLSGSKDVFNAQGELVQAIDENGNTLTYNYSEGALLRIADDNDRYLDFIYDASGHVVSVTDFTERTWSYAYDENGALTSVTDPNGGVRQYQYESFSPAASGAIYQLLTRITDESGVVISDITYNAEGKVASYTEGQNTYTYFESGEHIYKTDSLNSQWRYLLDDEGRKVEIVDPIGNTTRYDYDENGNIIEFVDQLGNIFASVYDNRDRLTSTTTPDGTTTYAYTGTTPYPSSVTSPSGRESAFSYDANNNLTNMTDPAGNLTAMSYNEAGDPTSIVDALAQTTTQTYNNLGLMLSRTNALGQTTSYSYDERGNLTSMTNAEGETSQYSYDVLDRMLSSTDPRGRTTLYSYDAAARTLSVTAANEESVSYEYDSYGRLVKRTDFDDIEETYTYRTDNLESSFTDRAGQITRYSYDANKRTTSVQVAALTTSYSFDGRGLPLSVTNETGAVNYTYDAMGRTTQEVNNATVAYTYNNEGELTQQAVLGKTTDYAYDARGLMSSLTSSQGQFDFTYDALGRRTQLTHPTSDTTSYQFNAINELIGQVHTGSFSASYSYAYDDANRLTSWTGDGTDKSYGYNAASEVTSVTDNQGNYSFEYDEVGNRSSDGGIYDSANRLLENDNYQFTYDSNGNLAEKTDKQSGARVVYQWNARNQLLQVSRYPDSEATEADSSTAFTYGPLGRRWSRVKDGVTEYFAYVGMDRVATLNESLNPINHFTFGLGIDEPLAMEQSEKNYFYFTDYLGSVKALTDGTNMVAEYDYSAYGNTQITGEADINPYRYTAREYEEEDLYYYRARYYDPDLGRFISSDPIGLNGGLNGYLYTQGNPINSVDMFGLKTVNLGNGFTGRMDQYNSSTGASFEIHVYDKNGKEVGIVGPDGWLNKHGHDAKKPPELPENVLKNIENVANDFMKRAGWLKYLKLCKKIPIIGLGAGIGFSIITGEEWNPMCDALGGCSSAY